MKLTKFQEEDIMRKIKLLEEHIDRYRMETIASVTNPKQWNGAENATTYACRLNGYIGELNGIFSVLTILGYGINYDKETDKVISIISEEE